MKKPYKLLVCLSIIGCLSSPAALAQNLAPTVENYNAIKRLPEFGPFFQGIYTGLLRASLIQEGRGVKPLFCPPETLAVNEGNLVSMLEMQMKAKTYPPSFSLVSVLVDSIETTFPCR